MPDTLPQPDATLPEMPDITPAQSLALVSTLATVLTILFKLDVSDATQAKLAGGLVAVYATVKMLSDAIIRRGRARVAAAQIAGAVDLEAARIAAATPGMLSARRVSESD